MSVRNLSEYRAQVAERRQALSALLGTRVGPAGRVVWEVGSGHGHFLTAYAAAHPEQTCIGVDIASDRVVRAQRKCKRAKLNNLHFFLAEADDFLAAAPADLRFSAVFVLFPDPWPKRRHHKNRVMNPAFLEAVAARAGEGTLLFFRTDHEPYYRHAAGVVAGSPAWMPTDSATLPFEEPTVFEKRADRHFTLVARRRGAPS